MLYEVITPFGTMIFLVFLDMLTGDEEKMPEEKTSRIKPDSFSDVRVKPWTEKDEELLQKMAFYDVITSYSIHYTKLYE